MQTSLESNKLKVTINSFGAELCSVKNKNGLEFIWQAKKDVWARHAPVLFPIVGKLKDNFFVFEGNRYELPQHGFARDMKFELTEHSTSTCTFEINANTETKNNFPFEFRFQINYQLLENKLITTYKIFNPSAKPIFFSVGAHPGFNCPLLPNENYNDYYLEFEKNSFSQTQLNNGLRIDSKSDLLLQNNKLFLSKELFDNDALVFENDQIDGLSLCSSVSEHKITLECQNWPFFGVWTKKGNTEFVCLEPWQGIADNINSSNELTKKDGIIELAPNSEFVCSFSLVFK